MILDPIIGRLLFVDGVLRPVFRDGGGSQYVIDGRTRCYGVWLPEREDADAPLVVPASRTTPRRTCHNLLP